MLILKATFKISITRIKKFAKEVIMLNQSIMKTYRCYGINIKSEVSLYVKETIDRVEPIDLTITLKSNNLIKKDKCNESLSGFIEKNRFYFKKENIAEYHIENGNAITIYHDESTDLEAIQPYLTGTALGVALIQRELLAIHGSAVVFGDKCVIFMGDCGAGKSTLCAGLRTIGYKYIADDISVITFNDDGRSIVQPGLPEQRLCEDAVENMELKTEDVSYICREDHKYIIESERDFLNMPIELLALVELVPAKREDVLITEVRGFEKVNTLVNNVFASMLYKEIGISPEIITQCIRTTQSIPVFRLERPVDKFTIMEQIERVNTITR